VSDPTVNDLELEEVDEVSLVDRGANQYAKLLISKRANEEGEEEDPVEKADPDPSSVNAEDVLGEEDEDEVDEEDGVKKGYFARLVEKFFSESATRVPHNGTLPHMSDVQKAFPGQDPRLGMFGGQQPPPPPAQHPNFQVATPAPGPQNAFPAGPQAFPAAADPMAGQMQAGPPLPDEVVQYIKQLEQALADAQGETNPSEEDDDVSSNFGKSLGDLPDDEVTFLQELSKSLEDEDLRGEVSKAMEIVKAANERAEEAEKIAKAERDERLLREFVAKAQSYTSLPVDPAEFGPVLKKLSETLSTEEYEAVTKALAAGNETMANASLFGEIGKRGGYQPTEAIAKVDVSAEEIAKAQNISIEAARTQVFERDPALYDQYLQEAGR
jgi:hypothetical protein